VRGCLGQPFSGFPLYPTLVYRQRTDINPCRCSSRSDNWGHNQQNYGHL